MKSPDLTLFLPSLTAGGAPRIMINIGMYLREQGYEVEFVLSEAKGEFLGDVNDIPVFDLESRVIRSVLPLRNYLRRREPQVLMSTTHSANLVAIWATSLAQTKTKHVVREPTTISNQAKEFSQFKDRLIPPLVKVSYPYASQFVAISKGVKRELVENVGLDESKIEVIYNPIVTPDIEADSKQPVDHPWFEANDPVILGAGRLTQQKDFPTLIRAFDQLLDKRDAYLVILGEGDDRAKLEALIKELGIDDRVDLPGYTANPYKYMRKADVFVLSSAWEGFGNVIVEAMVCGTTVVATDCESGPAEILADGEYGYLSPVGDPVSLCDRIIQAHDNQLTPELLKQRASEFTKSEIMPQYERYLFEK